MLSIIISIDPVVARIGPIALHWYGALYALGIAAGLSVAFPYAVRRGIAETELWSLTWWTGVAALLGGRLYYVVQNDMASFLQHPERILATWEGGMAFYGALFLGLPVLAWLCWRRHLPIGVALDSAALAAPLAQAIGRIGNLINGDIIGYPSTLPWATIYTNPHAFAPLGIAYQPAAAYELLGSLALFGALWMLRHALRTPGALCLAYLIGYSMSQFVVFFWRSNIIVAWGLKQAQLTALVVLLAVLALLVVRRLSHQTQS